MEVASSSSARIKRLTIVNNKKINGMQKLRDILLRFPLECPKPMIYPRRRLLRSRLKSRLLEQRVLELCELLIQKLVIAPLVRFDTHVEATEASKNEVAINAYKLGYLDCRNSASPCCPLEHEDSEQLCLDLPLLTVSRSMLWMQKQLKSR
ncbi:unnamed protein product [Prunus brigantina]